QGKPADARSDIFSFGAVLYEMFSGKRAFEGSSVASVIAAVLERQPAPLELSPPLDRVIRACLGKDPEQRLQTARGGEQGAGVRGGAGVGRRENRSLAIPAKLLGLDRSGWASGRRGRVGLDCVARDATRRASAGAPGRGSRL